MDKCTSMSTQTHTLREDLTLAPLSPGVHPPAKLARQIELAAKTAAPAAARLLSSVTRKDTRRDQSKCGLEKKRNKTLK